MEEGRPVDCRCLGSNSVIGPYKCQQMFWGKFCIDEEVVEVLSTFLRNRIMQDGVFSFTSVARQGQQRLEQPNNPLEEENVCSSHQPSFA
jgi:hypothetical protein